MKLAKLTTINKKKKKNYAKKQNKNQTQNIQVKQTKGINVKFNQLLLRNKPVQFNTTV